MILKAEIRQEKPKKTRKEGKIPAILYGPKLENLKIKVDKKEFQKVFQKVGKSSMINLKVGEKEFLVLVQDVQRDPISEEIIHIDFFVPSLKEEIETKVPIVFEGVAPAVKELGGTLVKNISEIEIKSLPDKIPQFLRVDISSLKTFSDFLLVKDIKVPPGIKILRNPNDILAFVAPTEKIEEAQKEQVKPETEGQKKDKE